jgi:hypothetical protein
MNLILLILRYTLLEIVSVREIREKEREEKKRKEKEILLN